MKKTHLSPVTPLLVSFSLALGILVSDLRGYRLLTSTHAQVVSPCGVLESEPTLFSGTMNFEGSIVLSGVAVRDVLINGELLSEGVIADSVTIVSGDVVPVDGGYIGGTPCTSGVYVGGVPSPTGVYVGGVPTPTGVYVGGVPAPSGVYVGGVPAPSGVYVGGAPTPTGVYVGGVPVSGEVSVGGTLTGDNITVTDGVITGQNLVLNGATIGGGTVTTVSISPAD